MVLFSLKVCYHVFIQGIYSDNYNEVNFMKEKIVLAYSGRLIDTSVAVQWLIDKGYDVVACCLDVGEGKD